jgi:hypothetical protein
MSLELLLAHADDGTAVLAEGLPSHSAAEAPAPPPTAPPPPQYLLREDGVYPQLLSRQRWGIVAPEGPEGDHLIGLVNRLCRARSEQQGADVVVYRVQRGMNAADAATWKRDTYWSAEMRELDRPRYLVVLGDLDVVSLELQQILAADTFTGRLAFRSDAGYAAYVDKVLAWEKKPSPAPKGRALFYTVEDGTSATATGRAMLAEPGLDACLKEKELGEFHADEITMIPYDRAAPAKALLEAASSDAPTLLFTLSHGLGPPRAGFASPDHRRALQGALSLGDGKTLTAEHIAGKQFLPGGAWFMLACYGGATPATSAYHPWLRLLRESGAYKGSAEAVLAGLPGPNERPFVAALPEAALANPNGPLAVIAHADIAWSCAYQDMNTRKSRVSRFTDVFSAALAGHRIGTAHRELLRFFVEANTELTTLDDAAARAATGTNPTRLARRAELWMLRQDLAGYLLLGDPAARLHVSTKARAVAPQKIPRSPRDADVLLGIKSTAKPAAHDPRIMEEAVIAAIQGEAPASIAARMGLSRDDVQRWTSAYQDAGRLALKRLR